MQADAPSSCIQHTIDHRPAGVFEILYPTPYLTGKTGLWGKVTLQVRGRVGTGTQAVYAGLLLGTEDEGSRLTV